MCVCVMFEATLTLLATYNKHYESVIFVLLKHAKKKESTRGIKKSCDRSSYSWTPSALKRLPVQQKGYKTV